MPRCIACDCDLKKDADISRGYCDKCQKEIRTVFDKDSFALGQYQKTVSGEYINNLEWTNYLDSEDV